MNLPEGLPQPLRIGTRGSPLALWQAEAVRAALIDAWPGLDRPEAIAVEVITTTGDRVTDRPLSELGGKGLFAKEIEQALLEDGIHMAVHSMKDMETILPDGLRIAAMLPREDARDVLIARDAGSLAELPEGAVIGTASLRRQAQVLAVRPDLQTTLLRGNVGTRIEKIAAGEADATFLALAGLRRLGREDAGAPLSVADMLPAVGQGAVGIETRNSGNDAIETLLAAIDHGPTSTAVTAERAFLAVLDGSCRTPIAGLVEADGSGEASFRGLLARPDGRKVWRAERKGSLDRIADLAADAGREVRDAAGDEFATLVAPD